MPAVRPRPPAASTRSTRVQPRQNAFEPPDPHPGGAPGPATRTVANAPGPYRTQRPRHQMHRFIFYRKAPLFDIVGPMDDKSPETDWNFADICEAVARRVPQRPAQTQGDRVITWHELDCRANALAADFLEAGLTHQSKVVCYLHNSPEYVETMMAAFKVAMVPVNLNFRYGAEEILYLLDDADAQAVVFHATFTDLVDSVREKLPQVRRWYVVADDSGAEPAWATPYAAVVATASPTPPATPWRRTGDDLLLLYTGGTTGMPKGVMWRQDDLFNALGAGGNALFGLAPAAHLEELTARIDPAAARGQVMISACPLMHGTGQFSALKSMAVGGTVVSLPSRRFDVDELLTTMERHRATNLIIVGEAFAGPILETLEANPGKYDLSSLALIVSSGAMWGQESKDGILRHIPQALVLDSYGSSEAGSLGASVSSANSTEQTARFAIGPRSAIFTEDGRRVKPGTGEKGLVSVGGFIPLGYHKDAAKTAATFPTFEGRRWSVPGDWATVNEDGTVNLLGRGSLCINTGGEKVFPEEVEVVLRTHPAIRDAVAVGVPNDRFGEAVCAVVETEGGATVTLPDINEYVKSKLASYKAPRHLVVIDTIGRAPNGKADYKKLKRTALEHLGA
jgi:acyl-CoA synthetase (AMP-forming)/AMP-acid ligase II